MGDIRFQTGDPALDAALTLDDAKLEALGAYDDDMRPPITHDLKVWPEYFGPLQHGEKTFEYRKDDRDYRVGDTLVLREWGHRAYCGLTEHGYTGAMCERRITYIARGGVVPTGFCIMSIASPSRGSAE